MKKKLLISYLLFFLLANTLLYADTLAIIAHKNFPLKEINKAQLKAIFLKKVPSIDNIKIFPINISAQTAYRKSFDETVLKMSAFKLKKYWTKAHYHGTRPPKALPSISSTLAFIREVEGAIAYIPLSQVPSNISILLKVSP